MVAVWNSFPLDRKLCIAAKEAVEFRFRTIPTVGRSDSASERVAVVTAERAQPSDELCIVGTLTN
jgi:hypothetical protein